MRSKSLVALIGLATILIISSQIVFAYDTGNIKNASKSMSSGVVTGNSGSNSQYRGGEYGYNPRSRRAAPRGYGGYGPPSGHGYGPARGYGYGGFPGYGGQPGSAPYGSGAPVGGYSVPGGLATPPGGSFSR